MSYENSNRRKFEQLCEELFAKIRTNLKNNFKNWNITRAISDAWQINPEQSSNNADLITALPFSLERSVKNYK